MFDGKGRSLCTQKDYANFEMLVDWKIHEKGDSGIYVRGTPQIQIWDPNDERETRASSVRAGSSITRRIQPIR